ATSLRYSEKLKKFYLLVNIQDGVDSEYAILCVADKASGPWNTYRLDNPEGEIKGLYDPGLLFDKDPVTGKESGDIWVIHGQGRLFATKLYVVNEQTGELAIDQEQKNIPIYNYQGGYFNEGSHVYKIGDTYHIISTPTWSGTSTKKSIDIQTKDLVNGPYNVKDIMRSYMNFGENGIHQGGIVDVPQEEGSSEWWSVIFQD
ncbi:family 43 glycosylhydrolase, partial [Clostridium perfringens]